MSKSATSFAVIASLPEVFDDCVHYIDPYNTDVNLDELVSYVYKKVNDTETNMGLRQIHDVINDRDTDTISMTTFYDLARKYGDQLNEDELRMLLEKTQMGGTDLTFDEFYTIMKGSGKDNSSLNMSRSSFRNKNKRTWSRRKFNRGFYDCS